MRFWTPSDSNDEVLPAGENVLNHLAYLLAVPLLSGLSCQPLPVSAGSRHIHLLHVWHLHSKEVGIIQQDSRRTWPPDCTVADG